jgi:hypothetical protein
MLSNFVAFIQIKLCRLIFPPLYKVWDNTNAELLDISRIIAKTLELLFKDFKIQEGCEIGLVELRKF